MQYVHIFYKDYTIIKPFYGITSIRTTDTGLYEVILSEPVSYSNTVQKLLFHGGEEVRLQGDIGEKGLEGGVGIPGVKGDTGEKGVK